MEQRIARRAGGGQLGTSGGGEEGALSSTASASRTRCFLGTTIDRYTSGTRGPEILIMQIADFPGGVAGAKIVSAS